MPGQALVDLVCSHERFKAGQHRLILTKPQLTVGKQPVSVEQEVVHVPAHVLGMHPAQIGEWLVAP